MPLVQEGSVRTARPHDQVDARAGDQALCLGASGRGAVTNDYALIHGFTRAMITYISSLRLELFSHLEFARNQLAQKLREGSNGYPNRHGLHRRHEALF
jgi:hypothetical protein